MVVKWRGSSGRRGRGRVGLWSIRCKREMEKKP